MKNRCKIKANMLYNIILEHQSVNNLQKLTQLSKKGHSINIY